MDKPSIKQDTTRNLKISKECSTSTWTAYLSLSMTFTGKPNTPALWLRNNTRPQSNQATTACGASVISVLTSAALLSLHRVSLQSSIPSSFTTLYLWISRKTFLTCKKMTCSSIQWITCQQRCQEKLPTTSAQSCCLSSYLSASLTSTRTGLPKKLIFPEKSTMPLLLLVVNWRRNTTLLLPSVKQTKS